MVLQQDRSRAGLKPWEISASSGPLVAPHCTAPGSGFVVEAVGVGVIYFLRYLCTARLEQGPW